MSFTPNANPRGVINIGFAKEYLKVCVAKICKRVGYDSISQTALLVLVDILFLHISKIISTANKYAMCYRELNLDVRHIFLALTELDIPCAYTNPGGRGSEFFPAKSQFETARLELETKKFSPGFEEVHKWLKKCKKYLKKEMKRQRKQRRLEEKNNLEYLEDCAENEPPKKRLCTELRSRDLTAPMA